MKPKIGECECQKEFKIHTESTNMADIFNSIKHIDILTEKFIKMLNAAIKVSFQKVRTTENSNGRLENLYVARNKIREHNEKDPDDKLAYIEREIADEAWRIVKKETTGFASDGGYNPGHL